MDYRVEHYLGEKQKGIYGWLSMPEATDLAFSIMEEDASAEKALHGSVITIHARTGRTVKFWELRNGEWLEAIIPTE